MSKEVRVSFVEAMRRHFGLSPKLQEGEYAVVKIQRDSIEPDNAVLTIDVPEHDPIRFVVPDKENRYRQGENAIIATYTTSLGTPYMISATDTRIVAAPVEDYGRTHMKDWDICIRHGKPEWNISLDK